MASLFLKMSLQGGHSYCSGLMCTSLMWRSMWPFFRMNPFRFLRSFWAKFLEHSRQMKPSSHSWTYSATSLSSSPVSLFGLS